MSTSLVSSTTEVVDAVKSLASIRVVGSDSMRSFRVPLSSSATTLKMGMTGIVSHDVDDQVVTVRAGTPMAELQKELRKHGQCLPWTDLYNDPGELLGDVEGTVGGRLSMNLPHSFEADCGNWRDWVLGTVVVQADGTVAKTGSKAVKNVAGYDVQKLFIGARGSLAIIVEVILRTYPFKALPVKDLNIYRTEKLEKGVVLRTKQTDFHKALVSAEKREISSHPKSSTLYIATDSVGDTSRFEGDWILGWGFEADNLQISDPVVAQYMRRAKELFDPEHRLNPGEMGIF